MSASGFRYLLLLGFAGSPNLEFRVEQGAQGAKDNYELLKNKC